MIEGLIIVGVLWLALSHLLAVSLREHRASDQTENHPVWTWPLSQ